ncbi:MAG TPA: VWA domain-containing protein, partial [Candidatus Altiarchaeales archaeon]|nr:VWA domain-containing protein [Candidatus Altiarchaeales archaeon]
MEFMFGNYGVEHAYLLLLIVPVMLAFYHYIRRGGMDRRRWFFLFSRFVLVSLIVIALASPFIARTTHEFGDITSITILFDQSESMSMTSMDRDTAERIYNEIRALVGNLTGRPDSVDLRYFSTGNRTEIGNALYQETLRESRKKNLIILLSDGNNNYGRDAVDTARVLGSSNTTVFALIPDLAREDIYIAGMDGDKKIPANADYTLKIDVGKVGKGRAEYNLNLRVDDNLIHIVNNVRQDEAIKSFRFSFSMNGEGVHKITASVKPKSGDYFKANNEMIKSVDVVERPDVLLVTDSGNSQLSSLLNENYDVVMTDKPRQDFTKYDVVYLDNQPADKLNRWVVNSLHNYIVDGNGLVVVGGDSAYERGGYHNSYIETLLPVISTEPPEKKRKEIAIVFLLDRSESLSYTISEETKIDVGKALAINILNQLDKDDRVGFIAFDYYGHIISPILRLGDIRKDLEDRIYRLRLGEGTDFCDALIKADELFDKCSEGCSGKKFVLIISDGVISDSRFPYAAEQVKTLKDKGIETYAIGVISAVDRPGVRYMMELSDLGGGFYLKPEEYERLKLEFEEEEKEEKDQYSVGVYNRYHFITRDLVQFWPSIKEFNGVTEKSISQVLVTTEGRMPIVTVWRFGLGRVVSLTTDNGLKWAPNIYYANNGELISGITNWAIGDLEKRKRVNIETWDIKSGEEAGILVKSEKEPTLILQDEDGNREEITLKQIDVDMFSGRIALEREGFYRVKAVSSLGEDTDAIAV